MPLTHVLEHAWYNEDTGTIERHPTWTTFTWDGEIVNDLTTRDTIRYLLLQGQEKIIRQYARMIPGYNVAAEEARRQGWPFPAPLDEFGRSLRAWEREPFIPDPSLRYAHPTDALQDVTFNGDLRTSHYVEGWNNTRVFPARVIFGGIVYRPTPEKP